MKKNFLLTIVCLLLGNINMSAAKFMQDSIYYETTSETTCRVVHSEPYGNYRGDIVIPETVFYDNVKLTVTEIGNQAFRDCQELRSVTMPNSITKINNMVFYNSSIENVVISNSVTELLLRTFWGCSNLKSVTIPNSVTKIDSDVFRNCSSLESVTMGNSVTEIGHYAFSNCTSLKSITIPNSVVTILRYAFSGCSTLEDVRFEDGETAVVCHDYSGNIFDDCPIVSVYVGRYIDSGSNYPPFRGIVTIKDVMIGNSVTKLWDYAFYRCSGLEKVTIGNAVTEIGSWTFGECDSLTDVTMGNSVTTIGIHAFSDCSSLESVTIPNSVTEIKGNAFRGCTSLASVMIPDSVTIIDGGIFMDCSSLTNITIGNFVTEIGGSAFYGCSSLESVTIGSSVATIKGGAFRNCGALTTIYSLNPTPPFIQSDTFDKIHLDTAMLFVPQEALTEYQHASEWYKFKSLYGFDSAGIESIKTGWQNKQGKTAIYTLDGKRLSTTNTTDLPKGIYVVNGKKVVVK